jgi:protein-S-isoprenylcysteine O-methyltransferase Ste14
MTQTRLRFFITTALTIMVVVMLASGTTIWHHEHLMFEESLFFVGIALAGFGAAGRAWVTSFISGNQSGQLVTTGPYSLCRNPLYLFSWMIGVGVGLCTETITPPIVVGIILLLLYRVQIKREESNLLRTFGAAYESYAATTPRFFPSFRSYSEPEFIRVSPKAMKKAFIGTGLILLLLGVIELLEASHQSGLLPALFQLY